MSTSHDPEKSSSETPDHSPSADDATSRDDAAPRGETAPPDAADQQSTLQYQPGHADGDQRAADLYGHSQHGTAQQPGSQQTPGHYAGGQFADTQYSDTQFAADQPAGSQQPGAHQYGSQPDAAKPGAHQYGSQPGGYGSQPGGYGQQAEYAQQAGYGSVGQPAGYAQPTGPYAQPATYGQPGTATPPDQRGFFKSLFDFRFNTFVATRWAGIIYILAIVVAAFAWIATIISGIAAGSASRVAMSYWEPEPSFSPWPLLFAILFGWIVPALWVIFVRLALELIVASVKTAEHTKRIADSVGR